MKKTLKAGGAVLGIIMLLLLLLPYLFRGKMESLVKSEGNKMLNARFDFDKLDISLIKNFPKASLTLKDFWLKGTGEFENDTLVKSGEITVAVNLFSLFGNSGYDVTKIALSDTRLHAIVLPDGKVNWDVMKPDTLATADEGEASDTPFRVSLKSLTIKNMRVIYDDRQGQLFTDINRLNASCSGDLGNERTTLRVNALSEAFTFKMNGIPFLSNTRLQTEMNVDADLVANKYTFRENVVKLNAIEAAIDGWVALNEHDMEMDLKLNTQDVGFKEILSLVPAIYNKEFAGLKTDGKGTLTAWAKGKLSDKEVPAFAMDVQVKDAMFRYPSLPASVEQINVSATLSNPGGSPDSTVLDIQPSGFRILQNPVTVEAVVKTPVSDPAFRFKLKGVLDLATVKQVYPLEDMELNGVIRSNMNFAGRMSHVEKDEYNLLNISGDLSLADMKVRMKDMPDVNIERTGLVFDSQKLTVQNITAKVGENDFSMQGSLSNYMNYALKDGTLAGKLSFSSNKLNLNDFMKTDTTAVATAPAAEAEAMGIVEVPTNLDLELDAKLNEVLFDKMAFTDMKGRIVVRKGKADMSNLSMKTMGGSVVMNGYYSTEDVKKPRLNASFALTDVSFAQAYKELDMVQQMAPLFEQLKGTFSGNVKVDTDLDATMSPLFETMQGSGSLSTRGLNLSGVKAIDLIAEAVKSPSMKELTVKDMTLDFTIKDGRVSTKPFDIKMGDYLLNLSGTTGLDQSVDYAGKVKLPASAGSLAQLTTFDLKIGGTFTSPKVSVDMKSMASQVATSVANQAVNKLGEKLGIDSTLTANTDSLKKKVGEKVTEKALDFLKKRIK